MTGREKILTAFSEQGTPVEKVRMYTNIARELGRQ